MTVVSALNQFEGDAPLHLGLAGKHQRLNAALAIQLCRLWALRARPRCPQSAAHNEARPCAVASQRVAYDNEEQDLSLGRLPLVYATALAQTHWPGRAEILIDQHGAAEGEEPADNLVFHLDGAHSGESASACADWFAEESPLRNVRVLVFNCMKVCVLLYLASHSSLC